MKIVLERCSSNQEAVGGFNFSDNHGKFTLLVLDPVSLINDHVLPVELLEHALLPENHLLGGDADVPASGHHDLADESVPGLLVSNQTNCPQCWTPFLKSEILNIY